MIIIESISVIIEVSGGLSSKKFLAKLFFIVITNKRINLSFDKHMFINVTLTYVKHISGVLVNIDHIFPRIGKY